MNRATKRNRKIVVLPLVTFAMLLMAALAVGIATAPKSVYPNPGDALAPANCRPAAGCNAADLVDPNGGTHPRTALAPTANIIAVPFDTDSVGGEPGNLADLIKSPTGGYLGNSNVATTFTIDGGYLGNSA